MMNFMEYRNERIGNTFSIKGITFVQIVGILILGYIAIKVMND